MHAVKLMHQVITHVEARLRAQHGDGQVGNDIALLQRIRTKLDALSRRAHVTMKVAPIGEANEKPKRSAG